ncbi:MAG: hypothetical protein DRP85_01530 [Candidatus Makaraimicrobium thalassicum]|nr:MAG: hypothetical protein DRP85_01530 [Candidatus Omnitrophota bacterium]
MFDRFEWNRPIFAWIPTFVWASVILVFSLLPYNRHLPLTVGYFDKVAHFFEYAVLALLMSRGMRGAGSFFFAKNFSFALILGGGYGIVMELAQHFVPGRAADIYDAAANIAGVICGVVLGELILWRK